MHIDTSHLMEQNYLINRNVVQAIKKASKTTGISFNYLMAKAEQESSFNPKAEASTSSATGMFQFTDQTWLEMIKKYGTKYGYKKYADKIKYHKGSYFIVNKKIKEDVLNLRKSSKFASLIAAEFAKQNYMILSNFLNRTPNASELYIAHFMGATGATKLIQAKETNPKGIASEIFKAAAKANKNIFYKRSKLLITRTPRTNEEVYNYLCHLFLKRYKKFNNLSTAMIIKNPKIVEDKNKKSKTVKKTKVKDKTITTSYETTIYLGEAQKFYKESKNKTSNIKQKNIVKEEKKPIYNIDDNLKEITMLEMEYLK